MTATLAEHHSFWHVQNGKWVTCPWDCGAGEWISDFFQADQETLERSGEHGVKCGCCKGYHTSREAVRTCYRVKYDAATFERRERMIESAMAEAGQCEHGMNAFLCAGPGHYPADSPYDD